MKSVAVLWALVFCAASVQADIIYLNRGEALSGTVAQIDSGVIAVTLSDGTTARFSTAEVFQVTDDSGKLLFPLQKSDSGISPVLRQDAGRPKPNLADDLLTNSAEYRTVYRFPFWPLLGGAGLLGYVGISQLRAGSQTYEESVARENAGLEFSSLRDRSQKQRTWGQLSIAGAAACLLVAVTPRVEKIPLNSSWRLTPHPDGLALCVNF